MGWPAKSQSAWKSQSACPCFCRSNRRTEGIVGYARQVTERLQLAFDYQSGPESSVTAGFTYNLTPNLQVNPALYVANTAPHHLIGYDVATWNLPVWKPRVR